MTLQHGWQWLRGAALITTAALALGACQRGKPEADAAKNANGEAAALPKPEDLGPDILTTVGAWDVAPINDVKAKQGRFQLVSTNITRHLVVNGLPWSSAGLSGGPGPIEANNDIKLLGILELPRESVAWVLVLGGTACPGQHTLVSIRDGKPLMGRDIPGCDDRGTIRRVDDHLVFDAGGSTGTYRNGELKVESNALDVVPVWNTGA